MVVMEDYLVSECQDINFTVLKPPQLIDAPLTGNVLIFSILSDPLDKISCQRK